MKWSPTVSNVRAQLRQLLQSCVSYVLSVLPNYTLFYKNQYNFAEAQLFLILRPFKAQVVLNLFLIFETLKWNFIIFYRFSYDLDDCS